MAKEQVAVDFLDDIVKYQWIEPDTFYDLIEKLGEVDYIDDVKPILDQDKPWKSILKITCIYKGDKKIGYAQRPGAVGSETMPEVVNNVEEICAELSAKTGHEFQNPEPSSCRNYCRAMIVFDEKPYSQKLGKCRTEVLIGQGNRPSDA